MTITSPSALSLRLRANLRTLLNISLLGGVIGIALGIAASEVVKTFFNMPMSVSVTSVIVSFAVCFVTGVFFGWYPARKASRLDPIEALRFE